MKKVGLGIIGLGYVGKIHLRNSLKMPNVNLVAVSDLSKKALNEAKNDGIKKTFTSYEQLLKEPDIDAVIIALPTQLHLQCTKHAAEAGKHIFLEKPIARTSEEAKEIVGVAQKNSVKLMMGYPLRFNKTFRELKTKMESGTLGDIEVAYATFISSGPFFHRADGHSPLPVPEWWFNKELTGGGALVDLGSHIIDLCRWYFGEITSIKSHLGYRFNLDFEDSAICLTKFESGTTAVITAGWFLQGYQLKIELFGTVDHAFAQHRPRNRLLAATQMLTTGKSEFHRPHFDELQYFANCLIKDSSPSPSGQDGLKDLEAISQAYKNQIRLR
jgi:myo-inositol 2-dehydrogenase/D-chiro-inositol 1-dehydrogenase